MSNKETPHKKSSVSFSKILGNCLFVIINPLTGLFVLLIDYFLSAIKIEKMGRVPPGIPILFVIFYIWIYLLLLLSQLLIIGYIAFNKYGFSIESTLALACLSIILSLSSWYIYYNTKPDSITVIETENKGVS